MTSFFNPFSLPILFLSILTFLSLTAHAADPVHLTTVCENTTFSANNSIYQSNLNSLLSSFSSNANVDFYATTKGGNTSDPVYGLSNCRGDVTRQLCRECVEAAVKVLTSKCSRQKVALTWYDECILRYSNRSFLTTVDERPRLGLYNTQNVTDQDKFNKLLNTSMISLMTGLAREISNVPTGAKKFRTAQVKISAFQTLYKLVQCTPDLSGTDCYGCLQDAIKLLPWCCSGKQGGRIVFPSCNIRYDSYPYYQMAATAPQPSPGLPPLLPGLQPPPPDSVSGPKGYSSNWWNHSFKGVVAGIVGTIAIIFVMIICYLKREQLSNMGVISKKKTKENQYAKTFIMNQGSLAPKQYSYSNIKKMTHSFKNKLGQGGFGSVYKGKLLDGRLVAVKVINELKGNGEEFINEVASISRTSHVNVVSLLGYCYERTKRVLVYEFMPNGSLDKFICDLESSSTNCQLEQRTLFEIAVGVARGLEYLHRGCSTRILHFDIKPQNILLDDDFCPKISDFGLARLCQKKESIVSMLGARGTIGYIAPEVFSRNFGGVSHKSDVYSYGMLILKVVGVRENFDVEVSHTSERYFPDWIYQNLNLDENVENTSVLTEEDEQMKRKMILVGLWCIQTIPTNRPSMTKVVEMLEGNVHSIEIPPKPFLFSPTRSVQYSSTTSLP